MWNRDREAGNVALAPAPSLVDRLDRFRGLATARIVTPGPLRLNRLSAPEKTVIGLLRGLACGGSSEADAESFGRLRRQSQREGMRIAPPDAPFLNESELRILGVLALLQRPGANCELVASPTLRTALADCATRLAAADLRLAHRNLCRIRGAPTENLSLEIKPLWSERRRPDIYEPFSPPDPSSLADRALRFVSDRRLVWDSLREFGLTRQFVRLMLRRGLLTRDRSGIYQASPAALRWLEATAT